MKKERKRKRKILTLNNDQELAENKGPEDDIWEQMEMRKPLDLEKRTWFDWIQKVTSPPRPLCSCSWSSSCVKVKMSPLFRLACSSLLSSPSWTAECGGGLTLTNIVAVELYARPAARWMDPSIEGRDILACFVRTGVVADWKQEFLFWMIEYEGGAPA